MLLTDTPAGGRLTRGQIGSLLTGLVLLAAAWIGPLPALAAGSFSAHMTLHMVLVAVVAPLLALGVAGTRADPVRLAPGWYSPIVASVVEFAVVSGWHAPVLHHAARAGGAPFAAEQASFLAAGLLLWWSSAGGGRGIEPWRSGAGAAAMLFTSIHMTLVGALFALAPRPLFVHTPTTLGLTALADQQLGGVIMLLVGGASYLIGGLWLTARLLQSRTATGR
jgi:putative membrane protein